MITFLGMLLMNISRLAILRRDILNQLDGVINQLTTARGPYFTIYIEDLTSKHEFLFFSQETPYVSIYNVDLSAEVGL